MVLSRIGFMKSMKVVPEISVKLLWNLGVPQIVPSSLSHCEIYGRLRDFVRHHRNRSVKTFHAADGTAEEDGAPATNCTCS